MNSRFLKPLKINSLVGIILSLNDAILIILGIALNKQIWQLNYHEYFQNETFMAYYVHIYFTIFSIFYTLGGSFFLIN